MSKRTHKGKAGASPAIPAFLACYNGLAKSAGLEVRARVGGRRLLLTWTGTRAQFLALDFLPQTSLCAVHRGGNGAIQFPTGHCYGWRVLDGRVEMNGNKVTVKLPYPLAKAVRTESGLEVVEYDDHTLYYGTREALTAAGLCDRYPTENRNCLRYGADASEEPKWEVRRFPGGLYAYRVETKECAVSRARAAVKEQAQREQQQQSGSPEDMAKGMMREYGPVEAMRMMQAVQDMSDDDRSDYRLMLRRKSGEAAEPSGYDGRAVIGWTECSWKPRPLLAGNIAALLARGAPIPGTLRGGEPGAAEV